MSARVAIVVFPGTNSETETWRICRDVALETQIVHWSQAQTLRDFDAYVLPGGFAYEDRVRAGAIPAHEPLMDAVIEGAQRGKLVLGICNGAQILLEAGLVPGTGTIRRPTAAFTHNAPVPHFVCRRVHMKLVAAPSRCAITASLPAQTLIPAWSAHGQGRLAGSEQHLRDIEERGHLTFAYADETGEVSGAATPNGSARACAGLTNADGNVLAIMPHPERDAWNYNHPRRRSGEMLAPSGGARLFEAFAKALERA